MLDSLVEQVIRRSLVFADDALVAVDASLDALPAEQSADGDLDRLAVAVPLDHLEGASLLAESAVDGLDACHAATTVSDYQYVLTAVVSAAGSVN